jgi:hypothetical protein
MINDVLCFLLEIPPSGKKPLKDHPILGKLPLLLVLFGLAISLLGVILIPQSSSIALTTSVALPLCGSSLFLLLVGLILVFIFYLRRQRKT